MERGYGCQTHFGVLSAKTFDSCFLEIMYVEFTKNLYLANSNKLIAVRLISATSAQKTFDSSFLDILYVEFMKNFKLAD